MTSNHYDILRVVPGAEDAVIRAAYRALMRLYHPDANLGPQAQAKVREITAAFAVLGHPAKRAAYDALCAQWENGPLGEHGRFALAEAPRLPMRSAGLASIALALGVTLMVAAWPQVEALRRPRELTPIPISVNPRGGSAGRGIEQREAALVARDLPVRSLSNAVNQPVVARAPTHQPRRAGPTVLRLPAVKRNARAEVVSQDTGRVVGGPAGFPAQASCRPSSSSVALGECSHDHSAKLARMAASFLRQSMAHADNYKQQLLLSSRNRSATSRNLCRSDDCLSDAYLRQIRETSAIMEGRPPIGSQQ